MSKDYRDGRDVKRDGENEESFLSEHTISMRKAYHYCDQLFDRFFVPNNHVHDDDVSGRAPISACVDFHNRRMEAYESFWSHRTPEMPIVQITTDKKGKIRQDLVSDFQNKYQKLNVPCLVLGLDRTHFDRVTHLWNNDLLESHIQSSATANIKPQITKSRINRQWFLDTLGDDFRVPLRYNEEADILTLDEEQEHTVLDADGRAVECTTSTVTLKEWVEKLEEIEGENKQNGCSETEAVCTSSSSIHYLKDWHLQQALTRQAHNNSMCHTLYENPDIFEHDMLNSFLMKFTQGDYRFCYWGPAQSATLRHSDVLHSFSWSYNVVGTKEWTFYGPKVGSSTHENEDRETEMTVTIRQETGQAIFVPATWQHKVVNLEETLSINHNWITPANLDLTWQCLCTEMVAIQRELDLWGDAADQDMEACENMLRGCVGLDVTSFMLMSLYRILEVEIAAARHQHGMSHTMFDGTPDGLALDRALRHVQTSEMSNLVAVLEKILVQDQSLVQLPRRLRAVLQSDGFATKLELMARTVVGSFSGFTLDKGRLKRPGSI